MVCTVTIAAPLPTERVSADPDFRVNTALASRRFGNEFHGIRNRFASVDDSSLGGESQCFSVDEVKFCESVAD